MKLQDGYFWNREVLKRKTMYIPFPRLFVTSGPNFLQKPDKNLGNFLLIGVATLKFLNGLKNATDRLLVSSSIKRDP